MIFWTFLGTSVSVNIENLVEIMALKECHAFGKMTLE